jgi:hypothetical protein
MEESGSGLNRGSVSLPGLLNAGPDECTAREITTRPQRLVTDVITDHYLYNTPLYVYRPITRHKHLTRVFNVLNVEQQAIF